MSSESNEPIVIEDQTVEELFICPADGQLTSFRCRLCGATRHTNQVSNNIVWMRNGRIVEAFTDALAAWVLMANRYQIPKEDWPVQFATSTTMGDDFDGNS